MQVSSFTPVKKAWEKDTIPTHDVGKRTGVKLNYQPTIDGSGFEAVDDYWNACQTSAPQNIHSPLFPPTPSPSAANLDATDSRILSSSIQSPNVSPIPTPKKPRLSFNEEMPLFVSDDKQIYERKSRLKDSNGTKIYTTTPNINQNKSKLENFRLPMNSPLPNVPQTPVINKPQQIASPIKKPTENPKPAPVLKKTKAYNDIPITPNRDQIFQEAKDRLEGKKKKDQEHESQQPNTPEVKFYEIIETPHVSDSKPATQYDDGTPLRPTDFSQRPQIVDFKTRKSIFDGMEDFQDDVTYMKQRNPVNNFHIPSSLVQHNRPTIDDKAKDGKQRNDRTFSNFYLKQNTKPNDYNNRYEEKRRKKSIFEDVPDDFGTDDRPTFRNPRIKLNDDDMLFSQMNKPILPTQNNENVPPQEHSSYVSYPQVLDAGKRKETNDFYSQPVATNYQIEEQPIVNINNQQLNNSMTNQFQQIQVNETKTSVQNQSNNKEEPQKAENTRNEVASMELEINKEALSITPKKPSQTEPETEPEIQPEPEPKEEPKNEPKEEEHVPIIIFNAFKTDDSPKYTRKTDENKENTNKPSRVVESPYQVSRRKKLNFLKNDKDLKNSELPKATSKYERPPVVEHKIKEIPETPEAKQPKKTKTSKPQDIEMTESTFNNSSTSSPIHSPEKNLSAPKETYSSKSNISFAPADIGDDISFNIPSNDEDDNEISPSFDNEFASASQTPSFDTPRKVTTATSPFPLTPKKNRGKQATKVLKANFPTPPQTSSEQSSNQTPQRPQDLDNEVPALPSPNFQIGGNSPDINNVNAALPSSVESSTSSTPSMSKRRTRHNKDSPSYDPKELEEPIASRRKKRVSVRPLRHWLGERISFQKNADGEPEPTIITTDVESYEEQELPPKKKVTRRPRQIAQFDIIPERQEGHNQDDQFILYPGITNNNVQAEECELLPSQMITVDAKRGKITLYFPVPETRAKVIHRGKTWIISEGCITYIPKGDHCIVKNKMKESNLKFFQVYR